MKEINFIFLSMIVLSLFACIEENTKAFLFIVSIHSLLLYTFLNKDTKFTKNILKLF